MFSEWLVNLQQLIGESEVLPAKDELRRLFEAGLTESDAWSELAGEPVIIDD